MDIKSLYLFHELSEDEITQSLNCSRATVVTYPKGSYIFQQAETPALLYLILSGTVLISQVSASGRQMYAEYLGEDCCFGETDLFLEKEQYLYSSCARTDVQLLAVSKHFFAGVCQHQCVHHQQVVFNMLHLFAEAAERNAAKIRLLTSGTLRQRIAFYLRSLSRGREMVELPLNREELGVHLNATRPSISRELSYLQDEGVLQLEGRKKIRILNFDLLQNEINGEE